MSGVVTCSLQQSSCSGLELATVAGVQKHAEQTQNLRAQGILLVIIITEGGPFQPIACRRTKISILIAAYVGHRQYKPTRVVKR